MLSKERGKPAAQTIEITMSETPKLMHLPESSTRRKTDYHLLQDTSNKQDTSTEGSHLQLERLTFVSQSLMDFLQEPLFPKTKLSIFKPLNPMVFMSSIEKPESKESTSSTKKFKMNTQSHTNSLNIVLESEIE